MRNDVASYSPKGIPPNHSFKNESASLWSGKQVSPGPQRVPGARTNRPPSDFSLAQRSQQVPPRGLRVQPQYRRDLKETSRQVGKLMNALRGGNEDAAHKIINGLHGKMTPLLQEGTVTYGQVFQARVELNVQQMTIDDLAALQDGLENVKSVDHHIIAIRDAVNTELTRRDAHTQHANTAVEALQGSNLTGLLQSLKGAREQCKLLHPHQQDDREALEKAANKTAMKEAMWGLSDSELVKMFDSMDAFQGTPSRVRQLAESLIELSQQLPREQSQAAQDAVTDLTTLREAAFETMKDRKLQFEYRFIESSEVCGYVTHGDHQISRNPDVLDAMRDVHGIEANGGAATASNHPTPANARNPAASGVARNSRPSSQSNPATPAAAHNRMHAFQPNPVAPGIALTRADVIASTRFNHYFDGVMRYGVEDQHLENPEGFARAVINAATSFYALSENARTQQDMAQTIGVLRDTLATIFSSGTFPLKTLDYNTLMQLEKALQQLGVGKGRTQVQQEQMSRVPSEPAAYQSAGSNAFIEAQARRFEEFAAAKQQREQMENAALINRLDEIASGSGLTDQERKNLARARELLASLQPDQDEQLVHQNENEPAKLQVDKPEAQPHAYQPRQPLQRSRRQPPPLPRNPAPELAPRQPRAIQGAEDLKKRADQLPDHEAQARAERVAAHVGKSRANGLSDEELLRAERASLFSDVNPDPEDEGDLVDNADLSEGIPLQSVPQLKA
jgi:hypothetical protein